MSVALFIPCYVDQLAPRVGEASRLVLERIGVDLVWERDAICCGQPFLTAGARTEAERLARAWTTCLEKHDAIVSPSASCVATVRSHYERLGLGKEIGQRPFELGEYLVRERGISDLGARFPHRVGLLQSCHGLRELGLGSVTEKLLRQVRDLELVPVERSDECCGFGGSFAISHAELSTRMGSDRLSAFENAEAEYVTGTDVSCLLHLAGLQSRRGRGPISIHLAEILAAEGDA